MAIPLTRFAEKRGARYEFAREMLRIFETFDEHGAREETHLSVEGEQLLVHVGGALVGALPVDAIDVVMARYGKALEDGILLDGPTLDLPGGRTLHMLRHRALYDVIARDFLVMTAPGRDALAELATAITGALVHLARAAARAATP